MALGERQGQQIDRFGQKTESGLEALRKSNEERLSSAESAQERRGQDIRKTLEEFNASNRTELGSQRDRMQTLLQELQRTSDLLSQRVKNLMANSEYVYRRNRDLEDFDFSAAGICLSKALEVWLSENVDGIIERIPLLQKFLIRNDGDIYQTQKMGFGDMAMFFFNLGNEYIKNVSTQEQIKLLFPNMMEMKQLKEDINWLASRYRNAFAHKDDMPRMTYEKFREESVEFLKKWVFRFEMC